MGTRSIRGPLVYHNTTVITGVVASYQVLNEAIVVVRKASGAVTTIVLPTVPAGVFRTVEIKDGKGDASTNNITISSGAATIDGSSSGYTIQNNYGAAKFFYNGVEWNFLSSFGGSAGVVGGANSAVKVVRTVSGLTDNTATLVATITVPNILLGAGLSVFACGTTGDGDSSSFCLFNIAISRIAGAAAIANVSAKVGNAVTTGVSATAVTTITLGAVAGAVGATNTFALQITVAKTGGSSTLHTGTVDVDVINTFGGGVTVN